MFHLINHGQLILSTNYWETDIAHEGFLYLTANAGALRLLVPKCAKHLIKEMFTGRSVTVEPSAFVANAVDIVFEDGTDTPFFVTIMTGQSDVKLMPAKNVPFTVWTLEGMHMATNAEVTNTFSLVAFVPGNYIDLQHAQRQPVGECEFNAMLGDK